MATAPGQRAPKVLNLPIGLKAKGERMEFDSLGDVMVPADRYWGAQTQRSLIHFNIGNDRMPEQLVVEQRARKEKSGRGSGTPANWSTPTLTRSLWVQTTAFTPERSVAHWRNDSMSRRS